MSTYIPNRVSAGVRAGGQFSEKFHSEADIDLPSDEFDEFDQQVAFPQRLDDAQTEFLTALEKNPTFKTYRAQFKKHGDVIHEAKRTEWDNDERLDIPGENVDRLLNSKLKVDHERPEVIGGMRVTLFQDGKERTVEVYSKIIGSPNAPLAGLQHLVQKELRYRTQSDADFLIADACNSALDESGIGCRTEMEYSRVRDKVHLRHAEVTLLPPLREFGDTPPIGPEEALRRIQAAQTTEEMGEALQESLGKRGRVTGFDTPNIDLERTREVATTTVELFSKYKHVNADVSILPIRTSSTLAQARASRPKGSSKWTKMKMEISSGKLKKNSKLVENFEKSKAGGWHHVVNEDATPMKYAVTHEFGHLLDYTNPTKLYPIKNAYAQQHGYDNGYYHEGHMFLKQESSRYGQTDTSELMAEAFADVEVNGKNAFGFSKAIHSEMVKVENNES